MKTRRQKILTALVNLIKQINGKSPYDSNLYGKVKDKLVFWDEVEEYPLVCLNAGTETRDYQTANVNWGFLEVTIRIYVKGDDAKDKLENIFGDIEHLIYTNNDLRFGDNDEEICTDIRIISISDDEGLLAPLGVGEMTLEIQYPIF
jgi:hypothetical protein